MQMFIVHNRCSERLSTWKEPNSKRRQTIRVNHQDVSHRLLFLRVPDECGQSLQERVRTLAMKPWIAPNLTWTD